MQQGTKHLTKTNSHLYMSFSTCWEAGPAGMLWFLGPCSREELYHSKACTFFQAQAEIFDGMMKETTLQIHTKPTYFAMHQAAVYRPFIQRDFKIRGNGCIHKQRTPVCYGMTSTL